MTVLGYYKDVNVNDSDLFSEKLKYFVAIENHIIDSKEVFLEGFNVVDGHFKLSKEYLEDCVKIDMSEYIENTMNYYTPIEYLNKD